MVWPNQNLESAIKNLESRIPPALFVPITIASQSRLVPHLRLELGRPIEDHFDPRLLDAGADERELPSVGMHAVAGGGEQIVGAGVEQPLATSHAHLRAELERHGVQPSVGSNVKQLARRACPSRSVPAVR